MFICNNERSSWLTFLSGDFLTCLLHNLVVGISSSTTHHTAYGFTSFLLSQEIFLFSDLKRGF